MENGKPTVPEPRTEAEVMDIPQSSIKDEVMDVSEPSTEAEVMDAPEPNTKAEVMDVPEPKHQGGSNGCSSTNASIKEEAMDSAPEHAWFHRAACLMRNKNKQTKEHTLLPLA